MAKTNPVLDAVRDRRSVRRFEATLIDDEKITAILEAGRWAPSWLNTQPWKFFLITNQDVKEQISEFVPTVYNITLKEAPVCIAVYVDPTKDPHHYIEAGAVATQNMALAAHSLGLGSCWIGVFSLKGEKGSAEAKIKKALHLPQSSRLIALLPIGIPKFVSKEERKRKNLTEIVLKKK